MNMQRCILVVLENGTVESDVLDYAVKLSQRMDCAVSLLMLVSHEASDTQNPGPDMTARSMRDAAHRINVEGPAVSQDIRKGDKASEFLKYIAVAPNIAAIVWGSDGDIMTGRRRKKTEHWFEKVRPHIMCPIVTPKTRAKKDRLSGHARQK